MDLFTLMLAKKNAGGNGEGGIDTSDANAVEQDLVINKTAYVKGKKITGTRVFKRSFYAKGQYLASSGEGQVFGTTLNNQTPCFTNNVVDISVAVPDKEAAKAYGITAEKIVAGNTIAGIAGTAKSGGIPEYNSLEELKAIEANEGDLAVVNSFEYKSIGRTTVFDEVMFPDVVTLPGKFIHNQPTPYEFNAEKFSENGMSSMAVMVDPSMVGIICQTETTTGMIQYLTTDNITFTRVPGDLEPHVKFLVNTVFANNETAEGSMAGPWHDYLGYFIKAKTKVQDLYQYNSKQWIKVADITNAKEFNNLGELTTSVDNVAEGDLAILYTCDYIHPTTNDKFNKVIFTVGIDVENPITKNENSNIVSVSDGLIVGAISLTPTNCSVQGSMLEFDINYTSANSKRFEDGMLIVYSGLITFEEDMKVDADNATNQFMLIEKKIPIAVYRFENGQWVEQQSEESGIKMDYNLLSGNNYTIKFAENPIEFLNVSKQVTDLVEGATISTTGHYKGGGSPDAAIGNYFRKNTNEVVRHKNKDNIMTYYAYFSDETLSYASDLVDTSAYTTPGYYTIDYATMSIKERVGSTLTLNFTYEMNSIRSMYKIVNGARQWIDINEANEEQWKENFKDLIEAIYPYEETIEVKELKAKIAELEAEMVEANTLIDQLNGEEV